MYLQWNVLLVNIHKGVSREKKYEMGKKSGSYR